MSDYKRLTKNKPFEELDLKDEYGYSHIYKRLQELEDKIENGTLKFLPCKVGNSFYEIDTLFCEYRKHEVSGFTVENGELILLDCYFCAYKAKEVCFSEAEAKKKLEELRQKK